MWIEYKLEHIGRETDERMINSDFIQEIYFFEDNNNQGAISIERGDDNILFVFANIETAGAVYSAFKDALNGYSATIDGIGYVRSLSSSRYEKGTLCAPAEVIDWHKMP